MSDYFGLASCELAGPFRRCYADEADPPPLYESAVDLRRLVPSPSPVELLASESVQSSPMAATSRAQARLHACFLLAEDPQRRLEATKAAVLLHQLSLIQHIMARPELSRVLIADEVGLGKTIEAGLLVKRHLEQRPRDRVLYLAPARLVPNVVREFRSKVGLNARRWSAVESDARLDNDAIVVASIQKAVHPNNLDLVLKSGPWNVLIIDECHHLSDWAEGGGNPNKGYRLTRDLAALLPPDGRLILLSGTPHQGHEARFKNILRLLRSADEPAEAVAGRVIFRTKENITDWQGRPLFPKRDVRPATVIPMEEAGPDFAEWYRGIGELYGRASTCQNGGRSAGWAKSQALQWAASSVEAGLALLCRLAIRRLKWTTEQVALRRALPMLRPYRGGPEDESATALFGRISRQIQDQQSTSGEAEDDTEFYEDEGWRPDARHLVTLLDQGVKLLESGAAESRWRQVSGIIAAAEGEKIVFFAQPIETVSAFARHLAHRYGQRPALIVGGQDELEREREIATFWKPGGPRFLVSSRAGGEGINLQCSRRLVHLDVPWNPMDLEQRTGRIHRFGSRQTVIVDTLVLAGTREADAYRVARERLRLIARQLDPGQFEELFSRVMSSVAPEEFEGILEGADHGMDPLIQDEIGALVRRGFDQWLEFNERYSEEQRKIKALSPGLATAGDLRDFMTMFCGAGQIDNVRRLTFNRQGDTVEPGAEAVEAFVADGFVHVCADTYGMPIEAPPGFAGTIPSGTNVPPVAAAIRDALFAVDNPGAGFIRMAKPLREMLGMDSLGLLAYVVQRIRLDAGQAVELGIELHMFSVSVSGATREYTGEQKSLVVRAAVNSPRRRSVPKAVRVDTLRNAEAGLRQALATPTEADLSQGVRRAVWPIVALSTLEDSDTIT